MVLGILDIHMEKNGIGPIYYIQKSTKNENIYVNVRPEPTKLLEENRAKVP